MRVTNTLIILSFLTVSCGPQIKLKCKNREQARAICVAQGIAEHENPLDLHFIEENCKKYYPFEGCYSDSDIFYR